jgi:hypothetical protein
MKTTTSKVVSGPCEVLSIEQLPKFKSFISERTFLNSKHIGGVAVLGVVLHLAVIQPLLGTLTMNSSGIHGCRVGRFRYLSSVDKPVEAR